MTWDHIAVLVGAVALLVVAYLIVGAWQNRRILAQFDAGAEPGTDVVPAVLPAVSTLPETDPDGWSARVGWCAWRAWLDIRKIAAFPVGDASSEPVIFTEMAAQFAPKLAAIEAGQQPLAIEPAPRRELPAAPKRRTRRTKTTIGATS